MQEALQVFSERFAEIVDVDASEMSDDFQLDDRNWDSLNVLTTAALIDELFNVESTGEELDNCKKFSDLKDLIRSAVA